LSVVGNNRPSYEDIKQMKYLRAFINGDYLSDTLLRKLINGVLQRFYVSTLQCGFASLIPFSSTSDINNSLSFRPVNSR
jgi:hypothetical protein